MSNTNLFNRMLDELNISLTQKQIDQFNTFYHLLIEYNKIMNLTSITDYDEVIVKHFIDSLSLIRVCNLKDNMRIIDVGTGAGFPGIPIKIAFPNVKILLLDSLNKRVNFLNNVIEELTLDNISVIHGRAEDFGRKEGYRDSFDLCVSRAVAKLSTLTEYCLPYVKVNGSFISYKGGNIEAEVLESKKAICVLGGNIKKIDNFRLPETDMQRNLILIEKLMKTPKKYPRTTGKPKREPL